MTAPRNNESRFQLNFKKNNEKFSVSSFSTSSVALGKHYHISLLVITKEWLTIDEFIDQAVILLIEGNVTSQNFHGYVSGIEGPLNNYYFEKSSYEWKFTIESPLCLLKKNSGSLVYNYQPVNEIISDVLANPSYRAIHYRLMLKDSYPRRPRTVKLNESDFNFFHRLLYHYGLFYLFDKEGVLVITDTISFLTSQGTVDLPFRFITDRDSLSEAAFGLRSEQRFLLPECVMLNDYNENFPTETLQVKVGKKNNVLINGFGEDYRYGENYQTLEQGKQLAEIRMESYDCQRHLLRVNTNCTRVLLGSRIRLTDLPNSRFEGNYYVINSQQKGQQYDSLNEKFFSMTYENTLTLLPLKIPYRPFFKVKKPPGNFGAATVISRNQTHQYADLNEKGSVWMKFDFEKNSTSLEAREAVRVLQHLSGKGYGYHFPLHPGTSVIYGCINGDIDRPIVIGAMPTSFISSQQVAPAPWENFITSFRGNVLVASDKKENEAIRLGSVNQQQSLSLEKEGINFASKTGNIVIESEGDQHYHANGDIKEVVGENQSIYTQGTYTITAQSGTINYQANTLIQTAKHAMTIQTTNGSLAFYADSIFYESQDKFQLISREGKISISSPGDIKMKSAKNIEVNANEQGILLKQPKASISIQNQRIQLTAEIIKFIPADQTKVVAKKIYLGKTEIST